MLQVSLPIVLFCPDQVSITYKGGTDVSYACLPFYCLQTNVSLITGRTCTTDRLFHAGVHPDCRKDGNQYEHRIEAERVLSEGRR